MTTKKISYLKKLRILKEDFGFEINQITCNCYSVDWQKWEDFTVFITRDSLPMYLIKEIETMFSTQISTVFGSHFTAKGISILLVSENIYYKKR